MSEMFFTNPGQEQKGNVPSSKVQWEHKEGTIKELIALGVPLRPAELSAIDHRTAYYICQRNRLTSKQTADILYEIVKQSYKIDGKWLHASIAQ